MNYEIEMKAHVNDREAVKKILDQKGKYLGHTQKEDDYYHFDLNGTATPDGRSFLSARIRKEILTLNGKTSSLCYFTYKRKEIKKNEDGKEIEVNEENEFTTDDASALEVFFRDLGAKIDLHKSKIVEQWILEKDGEKAHAELCDVPPLGDFLEIEIIKNKNDDRTVGKAKKVIDSIFTDCNIDLSQIEPRYYRDMLKDYGC